MVELSFPHYVVTGGAGAIGSRLVHRVLAMASEPSMVTVIDDLSSGYEWLLPDVPNVTLVRRDVTEIADAGISARGALVFHLAAFFANQNSVDHPIDDLHTNGTGTLATLMWASGIRAPRSLCIRRLFDRGPRC